MMAENVTPIFSPDTKDINAHIEFLYSGMTEYEDGKFELNNLISGQKYNLDEYDFATGYARTHNKNQSIYIVPSLLNPDAEDTGRCGEKDFYAASVIWCDIDDKHDPENLKKLYSFCKPNRAVITATHPHRRIQLWWKLSEPLTDIDTLNEALLGVCQSLGGDLKVTKPCQPMRLAGTINYPNQKKLNNGRIIEKTTYHVIHENNVDIDFFLKSYPVKNIDDIKHSVVINPTEYKKVVAGGAFDIQEKIEDGRETFGYKMVFASINHLTAEYKRFPTLQEVYDDVWPVYSSKVKIRGESLEKDGRGSKFIIQKIKSQLRNFERGAYARYGLGNIKDIIFNNSNTGLNQENPKIENSKPLKATSIHDIDLDNISPREFLYGDIIARKYVSMIIAPSGVGKSIFSMQLAVSAASSKPWGDWTSKQQALNVWIYNNEEGNDELIRRLRAIMIENDLKKSDFKGNFYMDSGENQSITIAKLDKDGENVIATPDYDSLISEIRDRKIDILIIDPFAETHAVSENSNDKIKIVTGLYRKIAFDTNCAVLLIHHARKGVENLAGNAEAGRGGGAQIGVIRRAFTLAKMSKEEATDIGVQPEKRHWYVRFDDAKTNITAPAEKTTWFKFKSVSIGNGNIIYPEGDSVGVLKHTTIDCIKVDNGNVISAEEDRILQCIIEYSEKSGEKTFPFNDAKKYIEEYSNINFGRDKLIKFMKTAMDKNIITEYMGGKFKIKYMTNSSNNNKNYIFIYGE